MKNLLENKEFMEYAKKTYEQRKKLNEKLEEDWKYDLEETLEEDICKNLKTYENGWEDLLMIMEITKKPDLELKILKNLRR